MKLKGKRVTSIVIVFMLLFSSFSFVYATEEPVIDKENIEKERVKYKKDQTIYVVLNSDGTVDQTIVMNRLFDYVGDELIDTGDYKNIKAISQNIKPVVTDHEITWNLTANEKDFYYEGEVTSELPITVSLKYFLNGEELTAKQIAGTTGQLRININVKQNKNVDRMHSNAYLTQIQFPVDLKKVEILEAPKAMQIVTGTVATISYSVMPDSDADYSLLLDVKNFEMDAMNISLISYDPMDENQYEELTDGLIEMEDGAKELSKGTGKLRDGLAKLVDAIKELVDGLFKLADGGNELQDGMNKYYEGLIEYRKGVDALASGLGQASSGLGTLYFQSSWLVSGYSQLYGGLSQLQQGYAGLLAVLNPVRPPVPAHDLSYLTGVLDAKTIVDPAKAAILGATTNAIDSTIAATKAGNPSVSSGITDLNAYIDGLTLDTDPTADATAKGALKVSAGEAIAEIASSMLNGTADNTKITALTALLGGYVSAGKITETDMSKIIAAVYEAANYSFWNQFLTNQGVVVSGDELASAALRGEIIQAIYTNIESAVTAAMISELAALDQLKTLLTGLGVKAEDMDATISGLSAELAGDGIPTIYSLLTPINTGLQSLLGGFSQANAGLITYFSHMGTVVGGIYEVEAGMGKLRTATYDLTKAYSEMLVGSDKFFKGITEAADGSQEMYDSVKGLPKDVDKITKGQIELKDGLVTMRKEFDKTYDADKVGRSFSFVTPDEEINSIQFIMLTPEIRVAKVEKVKPDENPVKLPWYEQIFTKVKTLLSFN